ncbi:MAG: hypothetical protein M1828_000466 [Chrysothrix sp. TS-e1954]|nr:MAG: hypothetical protein M1828_000466 [Chrysothrix sp. TS-e1954]
MARFDAFSNPKLLVLVLLSTLSLVSAKAEADPGIPIPSSFRFNDITTPTTTMASTGGNSLPSSFMYNTVTTPTASSASTTGLSVVGALSGTATAPSMPTVSSLITASDTAPAVGGPTMTSAASISSMTGYQSSNDGAGVGSPLGGIGPQAALVGVVLAALGLFGGGAW